jgi:diacylglycerol kinase family enzyme
MKFTNFEYEIIRTERRNHCLEHINNELDMEKCHCIVIVSGDGLMHEFVNSRAAGKVPVTHAPAGSGNAFAKYQMTLAGEACEDEEAIFLAVKGKTRKFNLAVNFQLSLGVPTRNTY